MDMSFFCKQKTAYEMRIRDWSSDVCSSDLKSIEQILERYVARFRDRRADWNAFEDAKIEGYKRAQHRFIGAGGSGKHEGAAFIPAGGFTLSEIGRASCRERVCQYVEISVVAVSLNRTNRETKKREDK